MIPVRAQISPANMRLRAQGTDLVAAFGEARANLLRTVLAPWTETIPNQGSRALIFYRNGQKSFHLHRDREIEYSQNGVDPPSLAEIGKKTPRSRARTDPLVAFQTPDGFETKLQTAARFKQSEAHASRAITKNF